MGTAYAYFTATARKDGTQFTLAQIKVGFSDDTSTTIISSSTSSTVRNVLPGDYVAYTGSVVNIGTKNEFAIIEFQVTLDGESSPTTRAFYSADGLNLIVKQGDNYITPATLIETKKSQAFSVKFRLNPNIYDNEFKNRIVQLKVTAYAIQYDNVLDAVLATNLLMKDKESIGGGEIEIVNYRVVQDIDYTESIARINNADQGFYYPIIVRIGENGKISDQNYVTTGEGKDAQLYHLRIDISQFSSHFRTDGQDKELTTEALDYLREELEYFRSIEKNVVVRFSYDSGMVTFDKGEPAFDILLSHARSVCSVLDDFSTTITGLEAGFIGVYGEMGDKSNYTTAYYRNQLVDVLLSNTTDISVLVRTPQMIYDYLGVTVDQFKGTQELVLDEKSSRLSFFNDGFLGNWVDLDTYRFGSYAPSYSNSRDEHIEFMKRFTSLNPMGGEVALNEANPALQHIDSCIGEMRNLHLSYLNTLWNDTVVSRWKNEQVYNNRDDSTDIYNGQTAYSYFENHFGYRFVLREATFSYTNLYDRLTIDLDLDNVGFGNLNKKKKAAIILVNNDTNSISRVDAGVFTGKRDTSLSINLDLYNGDYQVYLCLYGDGTIQNPEYTIQFANSALYNSSLRANLIGSIKIEK